ncbi:MAG TPA: cytidylate kinase-like family protein, partial [Rhodothermales bacterium]
RLFASGGSSLAEALGTRLGWRVLDRELVVEVARRLRRPEADVEAVDEHVMGPWERAAAYASAAFPEMPVPPLVAYLDAAVVSTVEAVLREAAGRERIIVVGHGAQCILRDRTDAVHVRLMAPFDQRVETAAERLGLSPDDARKRVRQADEERRAYLRQIHGVDGADPELYDVVVNTSRLRVPEAADLIARLVELRGT